MYQSLPSYHKLLCSDKDELKIRCSVSSCQQNKQPHMRRKRRLLIGVTQVPMNGVIYSNTFRNWDASSHKALPPSRLNTVSNKKLHKRVEVLLINIMQAGKIILNEDEIWQEIQNESIIWCDDESPADLCRSGHLEWRLHDPRGLMLL